jgi:hypothetical protein
MPDENCFTEAPNKPQKTAKISPVEKTAVRSKVCEATAMGNPRQPGRGQSRCAAGIAYAVERNWLIISSGLHSISLTEAGRQQLKAR